MRFALRNVLTALTAVLSCLLIALAIAPTANAGAPESSADIPAVTDAKLVPAMNAEFVGPDGVRKRIDIVDKKTTIEGVLPFLVEFDASPTRAPAAFAQQTAISDPAAFAYLMVGYRINFGEELGTTYRWPAGASDSMDEETGPPLFSRVFTTPGQKTVRLRVKDTLGNEETIAFTVSVKAPPPPIAVPPGAMRWPMWESGKRYTLAAGGDYRRLGPLRFNNVHNVTLEKTGTGPDPKVGEFQPDARRPSIGKPADTRARHIRLVNIDVGLFMEGLRGHDYLAFIGGVVRRWTAAPTQFDYPRVDDVGRSNIRYSRGTFFQSTELRNDGSDNGYVYIGTVRSLHLRDTRVHYDGTQGGTQGTHLMLRLYGTHISIRNNLYFAAAEPQPPSNCGTVTSFLSLPGPKDETWRDDDTLGPVNSRNPADMYGYYGTSKFLHRNQIYDKGSFVCNAIASNGGNPLEHASPEARVRPRLIGYEDNVFGDVPQVALTIRNFELRGSWGFSRNNRRELGAGAFVGASTGTPNWQMKDEETFNGPYLVEDENSRPVPSKF